MSLTFGKPWAVSQMETNRDYLWMLPLVAKGTNSSHHRRNRLKIEYLITDAATGLRLTKASTTQVAVEMANRQMCFESPPVLFEKLGVPLP